LQDSYVAQFSWAEFKMVDDMLVSIKCIVCEIITSWVKHITLKRENLEKRIGKQRTNHDIPSKRLKKNEIYYDKNNKHAHLLPCLAFDSFCRFYNELVMLLLGRIDARLSNLPFFFMFWKMVDPWLSMNI
jgi:hypothetical protein